MTEPIPEFMQHRRQLELLLADYLAAKDAGHALDRTSWLKQHPEFAAELCEFFDNQDFLDTLAAPMQPSQGRKFGNYVLIHQIGRGGMGVVYKARQLGLNRIVALKMVLKDHVSSDAARQRFLNEARAAAKLQSSNIVSIFDVGTHAGQPYFSMEYIDGPSLADRLASAASAEVHESVEIVRQVALALDHAHGIGIVHRDLKPSNIMLHPQRGPVVVDFGLALNRDTVSRMTQLGELIGTVNFMSPEQFSGMPTEVGPQSDIFSLGVILYQLLTGRLPHHGDNPAQIMRHVLDCDAELPSAHNPTLPPQLDYICLKAMAKSRSERYTTMAELAADLGAVPQVLRGSAALRDARTLSMTSTDTNQASAEVTIADADPPITPLPMKRPAYSIRSILAGLLLLSTAILAGSWMSGWLTDDAFSAASVDAVPAFRAQLPGVGSWTKLSGYLWYEQLEDHLPMHFTILLRCVGDQEADGRTFRDIELDVSTGAGFREQASLRVDLDKYRQGLFEVVDGLVMADGAYPGNKLWVEYSSTSDRIAASCESLGRPLPKGRLSTQDVLALLFRADVNTTVALFPLMHDFLRDVRHMNDQRLEVTDGRFHGQECRVVKTPPTAGASDGVNYTIMLSDHVPFTWLWADISLRQESPLLSAHLSCDSWGADAAREFPAPDARQPLGVAPINVDLADFRAQLPAVGGKATYRGMLKYNTSQIDYTIDLRLVGEERIDDRDYRVLELDVQTSSFREQARLLVDLKRYREDGLLEVRNGYIIAGRPDQQTSANVEFDPQIDLIANKFSWSKEPLPAERLSVHDVLAMLFKARVKTSVDMFANLHTLLRRERAFEDKQLSVQDSQIGQVVRTVSPVADDRGTVDYTIVLDGNVPFTWISADVEYTPTMDSQPLFAASLSRTTTGNGTGAVAALPANRPAPPTPPEYVDLAYLGLPAVSGSFASFSGKIAVGHTSLTLERVTVAVLEKEAVDGKDHQWLQITLQTGKDDDPDHVIETAWLLVNADQYRNDRSFHVVRGWVQLRFRGQTFVAPYLAGKDLLAEQLAVLEIDDGAQPRLPIRDSLSLLFGAEVTSSLPNIITIRRRIIEALIDDDLERDTGVADVRFGNNGHIQQLHCTTVSPLGELPLGAAQLTYRIHLAEDRGEFGFGWASVDLQVRERNQSPLFHARLQLRDFGIASATPIDEAELKENWLALSERSRPYRPNELEAEKRFESISRLARVFETNQRYEVAIKYYQTILDEHEGTLAAEKAQQRIDALR